MTAWSVLFTKHTHTHTQTYGLVPGLGAIISSNRGKSLESWAADAFMNHQSALQLHQWLVTLYTRRTLVAVNVVQTLTQVQGLLSIKRCRRPQFVETNNRKRNAKDNFPLFFRFISPNCMCAPVERMVSFRWSRAEWKRLISREQTVEIESTLQLNTTS